jgi:hypothetical protein
VTTDDGSGALHSRRRVLRTTAATVVGAGVLAGGGAGFLRALNSGDGGGGRLLLQADASTGVGSLEEPLTKLGLVKVGTGKWATPMLTTSLVTMAGLTWVSQKGECRLQVRFRSHGEWSDWRTAPPNLDGPDPGSSEAGRFGTAPVLLSPKNAADAIQVRVTGDSLPRDLRLALIHAAPTLADKTRATERQMISAKAAIGQPTIFSRAQWGANESWRSGSPTYNTELLQAHVHHSASSNGYAAADVPALIRSFYKYHTHSLGWSDIGYNFLVDTFGQIWEGRYGGVDKLVRGAHTLGFNNQSTGICVIGNYEQVQPTSAIVSSVASVAGWKLSMYGRDPQGSTTVLSTGSDKFGAGRSVTLPVIDGHRDTNDTACPGINLYNQLPSIRAAAAGVIAAGTLKLKVPYEVSGQPVVGQTLTAGDGKFKPKTAAVVYQWLRGGVPIDGASAATYVVTDADAAQQLSVVVTGTVPGTAPVTQTIDASGPVRQLPTFAVRTQRRPGGKAIIHLDVTALGVAEPDGQVVIKVGSRMRTVNVKKGHAVARFVGLDAGRFRVRCQYAGGTYVEPGKARDWIRIPGKGKFS